MIQITELNIMEVQTQLCEFTPEDEELPLYLGDKSVTYYRG